MRCGFLKVLLCVYFDLLRGREWMSPSRDHYPLFVKHPQKCPLELESCEVLLQCDQSLDTDNFLRFAWKECQALNCDFTLTQNSDRGLRRRREMSNSVNCVTLTLSLRCDTAQLCRVSTEITRPGLSAAITNIAQIILKWENFCQNQG